MFLLDTGVARVSLEVVDKIHKVSFFVYFQFCGPIVELCDFHYLKSMIYFHNKKAIISNACAMCKDSWEAPKLIFFFI